MRARSLLVNAARALHSRRSRSGDVRSVDCMNKTTNLGAMRNSKRAHRTFLVALELLALQTIACASDPSDAPMSATRELDMTRFLDMNDDPNVVEVALVAAQGTLQYLPDGAAEIWGYRDGTLQNAKVSVPGPRLEVEQGQQVVVHFENQLPEETTIHWHGLRVPNAADGTPSVQVSVQPGESYDYRFVATNPGTFWYHPHIRSDVQIERGLYGAVVVHGGPNIPVDADRTFVIDDVKLEATGDLSTQTGPLDIMLGRQGNVLLANGVAEGRIVARSGARERWRFINSANGRYFNLRLPDHTLRVIGWDGGLLAEPYDVRTLLIAPGERYEVLAELPDPIGSELTLQTLHYDRGHMIPDPGPLTVFKVVIAGTAAQPKPLPEHWGEPVDLTAPDGSEERVIELDEMQNSGEALPTFSLGGAAFPDAPPLRARAGDVAIWRLVNKTQMDHPIHLHGMFFRVLDVDGVGVAHDGWKDTVNVPQQQTLRFAVRYGDAGTWMFHCHILEHAERGMMEELVLEL
jgi:FtsP/CotA-like multicopper oxidase with cupredoxin domain